MRERADRRFAVTLGVILALAAFWSDLVVSPPSFVEDRIAAVSDRLDRAPSTTPVPTTAPTAPTTTVAARAP